MSELTIPKFKIPAFAELNPGEEFSLGVPIVSGAIQINTGRKQESKKRLQLTVNSGVKIKREDGKPLQVHFPSSETEIMDLFEEPLESLVVSPESAGSTTWVPDCDMRNVTSDLALGKFLLITAQHALYKQKTNG